MYNIQGNYLNKFKGINIITESLDIPELDKNDNMKTSLEKGAQIHKLVRRDLQSILMPGLSMSDLANKIETSIIKYTNNTGTNGGIGFPPSLSVSDCVAHFNPYKGLDRVLGEDDNCKIDFGVEVNGYIIDCAFSVYFDEKYNELHNAVKDATYTGIKKAGIDVVIKDWGKDIQEVMESYEIELNGKTYPIKSIRTLGGHNIGRYTIHNGIFLPSCDISYYPSDLRFKNEIYAIETFGGIDTSEVFMRESENTLFMLKEDINNITSSKLYRNAHKLYKKFNTLPFCKKYLDKNKKLTSNLNDLIERGYVNTYPPYYSPNNMMSAQYEHTILIQDDKKTVLTEFQDY